MFKPIVLSFVLCTHVAVNASGCFPAWTSGGPYNKGSQVSRSKTTTSTAGVLTTTTNNYECISGDGVYSHTSHCPLYDPVGVTTSSAWKNLGLCSGAAVTTTTTAPTYAAWSGVGCPSEWAEGTNYQPGALVAFKSVVYKCSTVQFVNAWCGNPGYKPGDSLYWDIAWTRLGSCSGTMSSPTPDHSGLPSVGGCPHEFDSSAVYSAGDSVAVGGIVLKCRSWPNSLYCSLSGFEPLGQNTDMAWTKVGYCNGTVATTPSSNVACPEEYNAAHPYKANDKVSVLSGVDQAVMYQCSSDIHTAKFCRQYKPGHWSALGWSLLGSCNGTIVPTDPFTGLDEMVGACPRVYDSNTKYEGKDVVSVDALSTPEKRFVYQCKAWPYGAYCNSGVNFAPGSENGELGWTLKGWCDATVTTTTTTSTPWVGTCEWLNGTIPVSINPWSASALSTYSAGTRVRISDRIYKCKEWPFYLWCKSSAYEPENSQYWGDAWTKAGTCASTLATSSTTISGNLTLVVNTTTALRRELLTIGSLSDSQTASLINAVKETIDTVACRNIPSQQACNVIMLTVNSQPITRQLRGGTQRLLAEESIVIVYEVIINFACSVADCADKQEIIYDIYATVTGEMRSATDDSSFMTLMVASSSFDTLEPMLRVSSVVNEIITEQPITTTTSTVTNTASGNNNTANTTDLTNTTNTTAGGTNNTANVTNTSTNTTNTSTNATNSTTNTTNTTMNTTNTTVDTTNTPTNATNTTVDATNTTTNTTNSTVDTTNTTANVTNTTQGKTNTTMDTTNTTSNTTNTTAGGNTSFFITPSAMGSPEASEHGIVGVSSNAVNNLIGQYWTVNIGNSPQEFNAAADVNSAVSFRFDTNYHSTGTGSLCIHNQCPNASAGCDSQKGYLQMYYDTVIGQVFSGQSPTSLVTAIPASEFKSFSYDVYPVVCGAAAITNGFCGHSFFASIRFVHKFTGNGGLCSFYDCSFDYELSSNVGPEGSWTTILIDGNTLPWRIRQGGVGCSCPVSGTLSINQALEDPIFANMILGTGYGEIASVSIGAQEGGADYNLHGCIDNAIFSTLKGTAVFDFEPFTL